MSNFRLTRKGLVAVATSFAISSTVANAAVTGPGRALSVTPNTTVVPSQVLSQGGTLARKVYRDWMDYYGVAIPGDSQTPASLAGFPASDTNTVKTNPSYQYLYAPTGTGTAQKAFELQASQGIVDKSGSGVNYVDTAEPSFPYVAADGTAVNSSFPASDSIHWAAGDAPINLAGLATLNDVAGPDGSLAGGYNSKRGPELVTPLLATAVGFVYNPTGLTVPAGGLQLSQSTYCGILTGKITDWSDPAVTADNGGTPISSGQPITVVHRSDGSGSTFITSYDLSVICVQSGVANTWTQGVGTKSVDPGIPGGEPAAGTDNTVFWPSNSLAAAGGGGIRTIVSGGTYTNNAGVAGQDEYNRTIPAAAGFVGYVGNPDITNHTSATFAEAALKNKAGTFVTATVQGIKDAVKTGPFVTSTTKSQKNYLPAGYPYIKNTYVPLPTASDAPPLTGFTFGYFYGCNNSRILKNVTGIKSLLSNFGLRKDTQTIGGVTSTQETQADYIAESYGLAELPDTSSIGASKATSAKVLGGMFVSTSTSPSKTGTYTDPVNGASASYTCTP